MNLDFLDRLWNMDTISSYKYLFGIALALVAEPLSQCFSCVVDFVFGNYVSDIVLRRKGLTL